jgi:RNA polymerase subunit RPABC4/transcription elongation factor Spt4
MTLAELLDLFTHQALGSACRQGNLPDEGEKGVLVARLISHFEPKSKSDDPDLRSVALELVMLFDEEAIEEASQRAGLPPGKRVESAYRLSDLTGSFSSSFPGEVGGGSSTALQEIDAPRIVIGTRRVCAKCGHNIGRLAPERVCGNCGLELVTVDIDEWESLAVKMDDPTGNPCRACGAFVPEHAKGCWKCGEPQDATNTGLENGEKPEPRSNPLGRRPSPLTRPKVWYQNPLVIGAVAFIAVVAAIVLWARDGSVEPQSAPVSSGPTAVATETVSRTTTHGVAGGTFELQLDDAKVTVVIPAPVSDPLLRTIERLRLEYGHGTVEYALQLIDHTRGTGTPGVDFFSPRSVTVVDRDGNETVFRYSEDVVFEWITANWSRDLPTGPDGYLAQWVRDLEDLFFDERVRVGEKGRTILIAEGAIGTVDRVLLAPDLFDVLFDQGNSGDQEMERR